MGVMTLPELGESIESADVTRVLVRPGERVVEGQGVIEVESEKATLEVPAAAAGVVAMVHVKPGDHIRVGAPVVTVEAVGTAAPSPAPAAAAPAPPPAA
ncbi:MAG TPA: biotin/lipoyl-containing protein, partial [Polyangia bacterium]